LAVTRRRRIVVVVTALVALAIMATPFLARRLIHGRDTVAFQQYVSNYVGTWRSSADPQGPVRDVKWVADHPDLVLAEGDEACHWLAHQPSAGKVDPSGASTVSALAERYLQDTHTHSRVELSTQGRMVVVGGAWSNLCWWERRDKAAPRSLQAD
jgi:hypothetical protein